jgi:hypothetical protein
VDDEDPDISALAPAVAMPAFAVDTFQSLVANPPGRVMVTRGQKLARKKKAVKKPPKASFAKRSAKAHRKKTTKTARASASASTGLVRAEAKENVGAMGVGKEADNAEDVIPAEGLVPAEAYPEAGQSRGKKSFTIRSKTSDARVEVQLHNKLYYVKKVAHGLPFDFSKTVSWQKHGGAESAWTHVKLITGWDLPNVD